jgi:hypothetical protein
MPEICQFPRVLSLSRGGTPPLVTCFVSPAFFWHGPTCQDRRGAGELLSGEETTELLTTGRDGRGDRGRVGAHLRPAGGRERALLGQWRVRPAGPGQHGRHQRPERRQPRQWVER